MSAIYNFHRVSDLLACSGQPREGQLSAIAADGYRVVINLGLTDGKYSLSDEAKSVKDLGLIYHHIPVQFDAPRVSELSGFLALMDRYKADKTLVHCAANYRASVFTGLYLLAENQLDEEGLEAFVGDIWQPDIVWQLFIEEGVAFVKGQPI
jgi:protein tyrosine phosphatase (PTP) superfamily phosphohydrolase (DUF442 family)